MINRKMNLRDTSKMFGPFAAIAVVAVIIASGCAGIHVNLPQEEINLGKPIQSAEGCPVGVILFSDIRPDPDDLGDMTSYLPPPLNTYRTAWVWGTLSFYCDEPLTREFTNAIAGGVARLGFRVFRCPEPTEWNQKELALLARRTGARRIIHGTIREFKIRSNWTITDPSKMSGEFEVIVFSELGKLIYFKKINDHSSRFIGTGEIAAATAERQIARTFRNCIEKLFQDPDFRKALEVSG